MEGDRLSLFIASSPPGPLPGSADPRDPATWHRISLATAAAARAAAVAVDREWAAYHCAVAASGNLDAEGWTATDEAIRARIASISRNLRPWALEAEVAPTAALDRLGDAWQAEYGDQNDPEVRARIARTVQMLEATGGKRKD